MKKILLVDDSALMRRVFSDIINGDDRFSIADEAKNGAEALELLRKNQYDAVVLDVNMPVMGGIELLRRLRQEGINAKVMMASTATMEGAQVTMDALELGALDFIHKPEWSFKCKDESFSSQLLRLLDAVCRANVDNNHKVAGDKREANVKKVEQLARKSRSETGGEKLVAIAISTGGPKSLQSVLPFLPDDLNAPVVIVQHMPVGFTASLADRMNTISKIKVVEAKEGDVLQKGCVYIAKGGLHLNLVKGPGKTTVHYTDEPAREGVKPCANYMYESLMDSSYDEIICIVMTGMGADGTEGIGHLREKKKIYCISQESSSCVVYGMPKAVAKAGYADAEVSLDNMAQEIILHVGVTKNGC
ncbi:MAG: chemotaxis-specific protein-glutamate methyltransferase CheB [Lachnospiraceae bacterium]|nr:chemotaxis-specific protein-glutamate methyltransferase CheB [Candidatus Colinaster scatohippi]